MNVALVYDRVNKWGGAERILLALHELFPDAPLYTSVYNSKKAPWAKKFKIFTSFLRYVPFASSSHEYYPLFMPLAFESFSFDQYDLVISVTSEAAKGIITKPWTKHICYCLTPTRYLWSGYDEYFTNTYLKALAYPGISYLRTWDKVAGQRPDTYLAISKEVQKRIKKYYNRDSDLIYPPVDVLLSENSKTVGGPEDYFLVVSRLVPYKRIDLAIGACNTLKLPLKIIGIGSDERRLKKLAGPTVEFLGSLTDEELWGYYKHCKALIFPGIEDFGIVIAEALKFGKPVIAYRGGGALETIVEGKTGEFFFPQSIDALTSKLEKFDNSAYNPKDCAAQANKFSKDRFKEQFLHYLETL